jgi:peptide/nickel transport system substrate-binding protein
MGQGELTRRNFLGTSTAILGAGASFGTMLRPGAARAAAAAQTLTVGTNIPFTTLDPNTINTSVFPFRNAAFDPLIDILVTDITKYQLGKIQAELATAYTVNKDYTEIRLRVRDGVKFHDGSPMSPDAVVAALKYAIDPATGGTMAGSLADIASVAADGNEVVLKTSAPSVDSLYRLTLFRVQSPKAFAHNANTPVGTGPFNFVEYIPGDHLTLERVSDYWKPIPSNIKTLTFRFFTDPEAMLNAALSGELDILQFGLLKDAGTLNSGGWTSYAAPIADYQMLVLNYTQSNSDLHNVNIRQAIARGIDRAAIVKNVYYGLVQPITIPMSPSDPTYDPSIAAEWDFNLNAAAEYVKRSGIRNPSFQLRAGTNDPDAQKIAQIIKGDLAKVGLTVNIALVDPTTLVNDAVVANFQANVYACSIGVPEVQDFEDCSVYRPNKGPFSGQNTFANYKQAYYAAAAIVDQQARIAAFKKVFETLHQDAWAIPICMRGLLCGQSAQISGVAYDAKTHLVYQGIAKS